MPYKSLVIIFAVCFSLALSAYPQKTMADVGVSADGAILMEQDSGRVLYEKEAHEKRRIASITKIMTAVIAIESGMMDETVKASKRAVYTEGSAIYLTMNERMKLEDLVYGLMLRSGNDAATAIAEHVGGSVEGFVFLMNQKAEEIGMTNTVFANPSGLDGEFEHYSTPYDMALLTRYAMENKQYRKISGTKEYTFTRETGTQRWTNKNRLLTEKYKYTTGGKTGFTKKAGRTLVTTASKQGKELIAVTLRASSDWNDHISMYEYGFKAYKPTEIMNKGPIKDVKPVLEDRRLYTKRAFVYPLKKEERKNVRVELKVLADSKLKEIRDEKAGLAYVYLGDDMIRKVPLYLEAEKAEERSWWKKLMERLPGYKGVMIID